MWNTICRLDKIVAVAHLLRQRPDPVHHGRHEIDPLHALASIRRSVSSASNLTRPVTRPPVNSAVMRHDERRVVIERAGIEQRSADAACRAAVRRGIDHRRLVIEDHLRPAGRAAAGHRLPVARHRVRRSARPKNLPARNRPAANSAHSSRPRRRPPARASECRARRRPRRAAAARTARSASRRTSTPQRWSRKTRCCWAGRWRRNRRA